MPLCSLHFLGSRLSLLAVAGVALAAPPAFALSDDFASAMRDAVHRMHGAMAIEPSGNPDRDFAAMMIPHHQGAIDMAKTELQFGRDERLRRIAEGIIVEQNQEIAAMRAILADGEQTARK